MSTYRFFRVQFDGKMPGPCTHVSTYKSTFNVGATQSSYKSFSNCLVLAKVLKATLPRVVNVSSFQNGATEIVSWLINFTKFGYNLPNASGTF